MHARLIAFVAVPLALGALLAAQEVNRPMNQVRLMTLDPGHFHAALVQKEMYPNVAPRVDVFAPLGPDLVEHLARIAAYNRRADQPTSWELEVHTSADYFERMLARASRATWWCSRAATAARSIGSPPRSAPG